MLLHAIVQFILTLIPQNLGIHLHSGVFDRLIGYMMKQNKKI